MNVVQCSEHGEQPETFVCRHILQSLHDRKPVGFCWPADSERERPDAWCSACHELHRADGYEWMDQTLKVVGVSLLCGECYDVAKRLNLGEDWFD
jgi:hypothetical protein